MIETVNESVIKIEPKIVLDGTVWGDITGTIANQTDLITLFDGKMDVAPTVLASETNADNVTGDGKYAIDNSILCVYNVGTVTYQTFITDEYTMMFRMGDGGIWSAWNQVARQEQINADLETKVDKIIGKGLSTNDYTTTEKDKLAGLFLPAYASIYVDNGNTAQSIPTGTTYTKITAYTTNGQSANCTPDAANDKITITQAGVYSVTYTASYTADVNNVTFRGAVFLGGVEQGNIHSGGQMGLQGALRSTACSGFINVTSVPADIDVRVRHDNVGSVNMTHVYANLNIDRIG